MAAPSMPVITGAPIRHDAVDERRRLRRALLERRLALSNGDWQQLSRQVCTHLERHFPELSETAVAFCWPIRNEPDLRPLIARWAAAGRKDFQAMLPVVVHLDDALAFRTWSPGVSLVDDRYGIPTPAGGELCRPQVLLVPVIGFDAAGHRLGYGGGYFDRTLALLDPRPRAIGVGFELSRVEAIGAEPHDQALEAIVTEAGVFVGACQRQERENTKLANSAAAIGRANQ